MTALIPFYAIGVFTGFSMAGFGMARYHGRTKEPGWRYKRVINTAGGIYTALVVVLFAVVKFTEGAWLIVILFPALVWVLIRLNREYRTEAAALEDSGAIVPNYTRQVILVLIDGYDMAVAAAVRYAKSQRPTALRAVHFVLDDGHAERLRDRWVAARPELPAAGRPGAARPHRGPDRPRGQPGSRRGRHHRPVRRAAPRGPACQQRRTSSSAAPGRRPDRLTGPGDLTALFYGRTHIPGLTAGSHIRLRGTAGPGADGRPVMVNPGYELLRLAWCANKHLSM